MTTRTIITKFPRTAHIEGSALQHGDHDVATVSFAELAGVPLVIEEKIDGANAGLWFDDDGALVLQSRGHALVGGARERHFDGFKAWAREREAAL
ncbi:MAG TPA: RNA ligase family protein, partial [Myxococcota bacterium]